MKRMAVIAVLVLGFALTAHARGGGGRGGHGGGFGRGGGFGHAPGGAHGPAFYHGGHGGGWHGHHHHGFGPSVFFGGSFYYPWYYPYPYYSYPYGYPYAPYAYAYPPPDDSEWEVGPPASGGEDDEDDDSTYADARSASYGLVQLRGVPDGAAVDLDGREWLHAEGLDQRWMALPDGEHVITVRVDDRSPQERRIVVKAGSSQTVRFGSAR
jgi:hypothetical protein